VALESASMATFAHMQRRLLAASQPRLRLLPVMAAVYAGNAFAASVPLAGPQLGAAFAFRRFTQLGVDAAVVGWTLVVAGVISSTAAALLLAVGAVLTGNDVAAAAGAGGGLLAVGVLVVATQAARGRRVRPGLRRPARWMLAQSRQVLGRPAQDPDALIAEVAGRLQSIQLPLPGWLMVLAAALLNWLADVGVLALSVAAVGAPIPWRGLLFSYGVGAAAGSVGVSPGGLGVVEAALAVTLMGAGVRHPLAIGAVLVYRFVSFWMVVAVGWLIYLAGPRSSARPQPAGPRTRHLPISGATVRPVGVDIPLSEHPGRGPAPGEAARAAQQAEPDFAEISAPTGCGLGALKYVTDINNVARLIARDDSLAIVPTSAATGPSKSR
jgi:uncharacterized membrane protein YbhN (UPF0104 family)